MSRATTLQKRDLECLRLATDCMQLASDTLSPALKTELVRMARRWAALAEAAQPDSLTTH